MSLSRKHEAHVVQRADLLSAPWKLPSSSSQQRAEPLRAAGSKRDDRRQLRHRALTYADAAGALRPCLRLRRVAFQRREPVLQRDAAHFRRVGIKLPYLLDLLFDGPVLLRSASCSALPWLLLLSCSVRLTLRKLLALTNLVEEFVDRLADAS